MDQAIVMEITRQGIVIATMITMPILSVSLFTGLSVSVFQAVTQVQENTLTFVPKMAGAAAIFIGMGSWMLTTLVKFMLFCFDHAARVGQ